MRLATCLLAALIPSLALAAPVGPASEIGLVVDGTGLGFVFDTDPAGQLGSVRVNPYGPNTPDCVFSPDGRHAFVTGTENALWVVDPTSTPPQILPGPNPIPLSTPPWNMEPTADGRFIVVCGGGRLSVVDIATRLERESFALGAGCVAADVCANGSILVSTFFPEGLRRLTIDAAGHVTDTGESVPLPFAGAIVCAPDSGSGVVTGYGGSIRSFRLPGFVFVNQTTLPSFGTSALMAHDGSRYYLRSGDGMLTAFDYDPATAELGLAPAFSFDTGFTDGLYGNNRMALDSSGQTLYVTAPHRLYVLDAVTGAVQAPIALPDLQTDGGICLGPQVAGCSVAACDDGNPCTNDGCNEAGCVHVADDSNLCGDDEACDVAHVCRSGACVASAPVGCNAPCPPGFGDLNGNGLCERTYDVDASLLDGLDESCDGTGANRYNCSGDNYGFHWLDESAGVGPVESFVVSFVSGRRCEEGYGRLLFNGLSINFVTSPVDCSCDPVHVPLGHSFGPAAYERNGVNRIFITPSGGCEGLSASPLLDGWFARVTVRYFPRDPACGSGACNPATHRCGFPTANCDDGDACTTDACDGAGGCTHAPKAEYERCGDANFCNGDEYCHEDGTCYADYLPSYCGDPYPCTLDGCDPWNGCVSIVLPPGASCSDGNPCNGRETCDVQLQCNAGTPPDCDDHNPCTRDACAPYVGCTHDPEPAYTSCDNGNPCDGHDTCDGFGTCISSGSPCYPDGNPCTLEFCDPVYGCGEQPAPAGYSCNDGNACNGDEVCNGAGTCLPAIPLRCDDGNVCTSDSCDPATGCVHSDNSAPCDDGNACTRTDVCAAGRCVGSDPAVCGALDQCHTSGACDPASGLCANPVKPDGTVCSDNDLCTTGETCRTGVCTRAGSGFLEPNPRTNGYYRRLCLGPHSGDALTDADAACVASVASTFGGISTVADICAELTPSQPNNDPCDRSDDDLMVLALNICRARVCTAQSIDSQCGDNADVNASLSESNAIQADPSRAASTCAHAKCLDEEINTGRALEMNSLLLRRESGAIRLDWNPPYLNDGAGLPSQYHVWRRPQGSLAPFVQIGATAEASFLDTTADVGAYQYEVTAVMH